MNRCLWKLVNAAKNGFDAAWQQLRNVADYDARGFQVLEPVAMASGLSSSKNIEIVVAVIADANGRILMVRKRDTKALIHPGGKRRPGERALDTLDRELREELGVEMLSQSVQRLGLFEELAEIEQDRLVCDEAYDAN